MQIVIEKSTSKAIYLFPDFEPITITETGMRTSTVRALDIRSSTHEVVNGAAPDLWAGGGTLTFNGAWAVANAEAYAEAVEAAMATLQEGIVKATQQRLDDFAKERGYDSILSACTYTGSKKPKFNVEGQCAKDARDDTWAALYVILGEVQAGTRAVPRGFGDIEADLPTLSWPAES